MKFRGVNELRAESHDYVKTRHIIFILLLMKIYSLSYATTCGSGGRGCGPNNVDVQSSDLCRYSARDTASGTVTLARSRAETSKVTCEVATCVATLHVTSPS